MLSIAQNTALFALIGTIYGGDGQTTFALPDLQGRVPIGQGDGPGLPDYIIGEESGTPTVTLTTNNLPMHIHMGQGITATLPVSTGGGDQATPDRGFLANQGTDVYSSVSTPNSFYGAVGVSGNTGVTGGGIPFSVANPYLVLNYSIAIEGIFPSRN